MMQINITRISAVFYEHTQKPSNMYGNRNCRIEVYNLLYAIIITTHHLCPPSTELILAIIKAAYVRDCSLNVRTRCGVILNNIEKIIHPQKESLLFTIADRELHNTFVKMGQESALREFHVSNFLCNDKTIDDSEALQVKKSTISPLSNSLFTSYENDNTENVNEAQTTNTAISKINEKNQNMGIEAADIGVMNFVKDKVDNVIEIETIQNTAHDNSEILDEETYTSNKNIYNSPNSSELVLRVDIGIDEPMKKKQKLNEATEMKNFPDNDEDNVLAEIASQFVDELE